MSVASKYELSSKVIDFGQGSVYCPDKNDILTTYSI